LNNSFDPPSQLIKCILGISLFTYFITTPNVQENMDGCILPKEKGTPTVLEIQPMLLDSSSLDMEAIAFDKKVKLEHAYISPDFDLAAMAKTMEIPASKLSKLLKNITEFPLQSTSIACVFIIFWSSELLSINILWRPLSIAVGLQIALPFMRPSRNM